MNQTQLHNSEGIKRAQALELMLKNIGASYQIEVSNYTYCIQFGQTKEKTILNQTSPRAFAVGRMIEKDLKEFTANEIPPVEISDFVDYYTAPEFDYMGPAFEVDINSAYASILSSEGWISEKTDRALSALPKKDRLTAVGIIASNKSIFSMKGDIVQEFKIEQKETSGVFFHLARQTHKLMTNAVGPDFLFSWVDACFFSSQKAAKSAQDYFLSQGFTSTIKKLSGYHQASNGQKWFISFWDQTKEKNTSFNIPLKGDRGLKKALLSDLSFWQDFCKKA